MKSVAWLLTCIVSATLWGCSSAESYSRQGYDFYQVDRIAVVDVIGPVGGEAGKNQIADFFVMELLKKGYSPIERSQVRLLLNEQQFQASDITSSDGVARAGEILNVPVVMYINVPKFDSKIALTVKMVDVQDGSILWMGTAEGSADKPFGAFLGATAGAIAADEDDAVVGGAAGYLLTPHQEKVVRELTAKLCKSIPNRK